MGDEYALSPKPRQERPQVNPGLGLPARPVGDGIRGELPRGSGRPRMRSVRPATHPSVATAFLCCIMYMWHVEHLPQCIFFYNLYCILVLYNVLWHVEHDVEQDFL